MAISGKGAKLTKDDGTGTFTSVGEVLNINGPSMSRATIDSTHLGVVDGYRTFIAGLRDPGQVSFTMNYDRQDYDAIKTDFESDTVQTYAIELDDADNTVFQFDGLVTELPLTIPTDDRVTGDVSIQVSGKVTVQSG